MKRLFVFPLLAGLFLFAAGMPEALVAQTVGVATSSLPNGIVNGAYSTTLMATGGTTPYTWSVLGGFLPPGLSLDPVAGAVSGTPSAYGVFNFTVQVSDASTPPQTASSQLSISISAPQDSAPGGPILVITNAANPFSAYYSEILLTEGLNEFAAADVSSISPATLGQYDVVILGETPLSLGQVTDLTNWVNAGGNLIAMRPDKQLAGLLGLTDALGTITNAYLLVNTSSGPGVGIVGQTIQFHGVADRYTLSGASSLAALYSDAQTSTTNPAVTLRGVGSGQVAAFTFDLALSIIYTRQGNPAWSGEQRDGQQDSSGDGQLGPVRAVDLFYGAASFDPEPDWVNLDKVAIPQADEQQRFLANLVITMNAHKKPLPRFWYFPHGYQAVIVMTGDDHAGIYGGSYASTRFDQYLAASPAGGSVDDWTVPRCTAHIFISPSPSLTNDAQAAAYSAAGFEIGVHLNTGCSNYDGSALDGYFTDQMGQFSAMYPSLPGQTSHRIHCVAWSSYSMPASVSLAHGIRLETSYYYWPPSWVNNQPGFFTGSGMPMRFADTNGATMDIYQATTQMTDESGQIYPYTVDTLLNQAFGPEGYYGAFVANMHTDTYPEPDADAIFSSATNHGVPIISCRQLLTWLDARNGSSITSIAGNTNQVSFSVLASAGSTGIQAMVPVPSGRLVGAITSNNNAVGYSLNLVKGLQYAVFPANSGDYVVTFVADTTPPTVTSVSPTNGAVTVGYTPALTVTFSAAMNATTINTNTIILQDSLHRAIAASVSYDPSTWSAVLTPQSALSHLMTYTATVKSGAGGVSDVAGNVLATDYVWSFTTADGDPISLWDSTPVPAVITVDDTNSVVLGLKFQSLTDGYITGISFYKGPQNTGTHLGSVWTSTGTLLGSVTFLNETTSGWQYQALTNPVPIASNTTYVVSYYAPVGEYSADAGYFTSSGVTNYPLVALSTTDAGGNGVFGYGGSGVFPTSSFNAANYWVDVEYVNSLPPDTTPPTVISVSPTNGAVGVSAGTAVTVIFSEAMDPATITNGTITLSNAMGVLVPSTVAYYPAMNTAVLTPDGLLALSTTYTVVVASGSAGVMDLYGNALTSTLTSSFSTSDQAAYTIWPATAIPTHPTYDMSDTNSYEFGVKFKSDVSGYVTGVRFYKGPNNSGTHIGNLWTSDGVNLESAIFTGETSGGWQEVSFATPVAITAGTIYVASYFDPHGGYSVDLAGESGGLASGVDNPPLHALANSITPNGVLIQSVSSAFPTNSGNGVNYWVDVNFVESLEAGTTPPTVSSVNPAGGAVGVSVDTTVSVTFSEAMAPATISGSTITLSNVTAGGLVSATVAYYGVTNTAVLTPSSPLAQSTTYMVTVAGGPTGVENVAGNALASTFTASFATTLPDTPPTVISVYPVGGALGVSVGTTVFVTFSEAMNPPTITNGTITLSNAMGVLVPSTVAYYAATNTAVLTPSNLLAQSTTYTVTVAGGPTGVEDLAGTPLVSTLTSSFTTTNQPAYTIWPASAIPTHPTYDVTDTNSYEFGVKFTSDAGGYVTGVRFYKGPNNSGTHIGNLWTSDGINLASAIFTGETGGGWQEASFATPVAITAGTTYVASYFDPHGGYSADLAGEPGGLASGVDNPPLQALANSITPNDVLIQSASSAFPTNSGNGVNYWVDVVFMRPVLTVTANNTNKVYGSTQLFSGTEFTVSGTLFNGDAVTNVTLASAGAPGTAPTGSYAITPSAAQGVGLSNYGIVYNNGTLTVNPATLTVSSGLAANNKVYDGTTVATISSNSVVLAGVVGADVVSLSTNGYGASFASAGVSNGIAVSVSGLSLSGSSATNYTLTQPVVLAGNITGKGLTVSSGLAANNKVYDGTTVATISSNSVVLAGVVGADVVSLSTNGYGASFASAGVSNGIAVSVSGLSLSGASATNYTLIQPVVLAGNITGKALTVSSGLAANNKVYDGTTSATISSNNVVLGGVVGADVVNLSTNGYGASFASAGASNGIAVTVSGLTLTGSSVTNYTLMQPVVLAANISPAGLLVTGITASNKVYDGTTVATLNTSNAAFVRVPPLPARPGDIAFSYLARTNDTTARLSYVTSESYQVGSNCLALAAIVNSDSSLTPTNFSGNGLSWQRILTTNFSTLAAPFRCLTVYAAMSNNISALGQGTVQFKTNQTGCCVYMCQFSNVWFTNGVLGAIVQTNLMAANSSANPSNVLSALQPGGQDAVVAFFGGASNPFNATNATPGWTKDVDMGYNNPSTGLGAYHFLQSTTNTLVLTRSASDWASAMMELRSLNSGPPQGPLGGDDVTLVTAGATGTFSDAYVGVGKTVQIAGLTISGSDASNYSLTQPTTTANITPALLTVSSGLAANNKVYDGTTVATISSNNVVLAGVVGADVVSLTTNGYGASFASAGVSNGIGVSVSGLSLSGASATNYTLTQPVVLAGNITGKGLTVSSGLAANNKVYDGTTVATISSNSVVLAGVVGANVVSLSTNGYGASFASAGVSNGIAVSVSGLSLSGASATNYTLTQPVVLAGNITGKALTVSSGLAANNKVYDGTTVATISSNSVVLAGVVGADAVSLATNGYGASFASAGVSNGIAVSVSGLSLSGASATNYTLTQPVVLAANITGKALAVSSGLAANNKVYDGTTVATISSNSVVLAGVVGADVVSLTTNGYGASFASAGVSNGIAVSVSGLSLSGASATNYTLTQPVVLAANITPAFLTVSSGLAANNKVYDGTTVATISSNNVVLAGVVGADAVSLATNGYGASFASAGVSNGIAVSVSGLSLSGASATNYTLTQPVVLAGNITGKALTVSSGLAANNKVYDGTTVATISSNTVVLAGVVGADVVSLSTNGYGASFASAGVSNGIGVSVSGLSLSGASATNYTLTQPVVLAANITGKALMVSSGLAANNKVYDGTTVATISSNTVVLAGVVGADVVSLSTNGYGASFASAGVSNGIAVSVSGLSLSGASATNYTLTQPVVLAANITPALLTVSSGLAANNKVYDGTTVATISSNSVVLAGVVGADVVSLSTNGYGASFGSAGVSNGIAVSVSGLSLSGSSATNYTLTQPVVLAANITPGLLTVSSGLAANNKVYDGTTVATISSNTVVLVGVVGADVVSLSTNGYGASFGSAGVSNGIAVSVSGLSLSGSSATNYTLTQPVVLAGNITGKALTVSSGLAANNKVYDGTTVATISSNSVVLAGVVGADVVSLSTNGYGASFGSAGVSNGIAVSVSGLSLSGASATNYTLTQPVVLAANITGKALTVSSGLAANNKVYDGTTVATISSNNVVLAGVVGADVVSLSTNGYGASFASAGVSNGIVVSVSGLSLSGLSATNYTLTQPVVLAANITGKALTVSSGLAANNKVYDGTTVATISSNNVVLAGVVGADVVSLSTNGYGASFGSAGVSNGIAVSVSGLSLSGSSATNYTLTQPVVLAANITGKALTVSSGLAANNKVYDGTTVATISSNTVVLARVVGADVVSLSTNGYVASFGSAGVSNGIAVSVSGLSLSGSSATNYTLTQPVVLAGNITGKALTVSSGLAANNKVYDGTTVATISSNSVVLAGVVGADVVSLSTNGYGASFGSAGVSNGIAVSVSGLSLSGSSATNYTLTQPVVLAGNITGKALTVSSGLAANNKVYDGTTVATISSNSVVLAGVVGADVVSLSTNGYGASFGSAGVSNGIAVSVSGLSLSGSSATNYTLTQPVVLAGNITGKALTVSSGLAANNKVYDGTTSATISSNTVVLAGVVGADVVSLSTNGYVASFGSAGVSNGIAVSVSGLSLSGASATNYTLTQPVVLAGNITGKALTVSSGLAANNKVYDGTTVATISSNNVVLAGVVGADVVSLSTNGYVASFGSAGVSNGIAVSVSGLSLSGASATNYTLTQPVVLAGNITGKALTVSSGLAANNKVYDGTTVATISSNNVALAGVVGADVVSLSTNGYGASFGSAGVSNGIAVSVSGLSLSGASATNYTLTQPVVLAANITPALLTVSSGLAANNKVYDGTTVATISSNNVVLAGVVGADVVSLSTNGYVASFASAGVSNGIAVSVSGLSLSGLSATNYTLTQPVVLAANITGKALTVSSGLAANNKVYDGTTVATISSNSVVLAGVVGADAVSLATNGYGASFGSAGVSNGIAVSVSGLSLSGASATNYTLTQPVVLAGNITGKALTVSSGLAANNKVYDGTTVATISSNNVVLAGVVGADVVSLSTNGYGASFGSAGVSNGIGVSVSGLGLSGASATNYTLTQPVVLAGNITGKVLTVSSGLAANNKVYDGTTVATISSNNVVLAGVVGADVVSLSTNGYVASFGSAGVSNGIAVSVSGLSLSGASGTNYTLTQPVVLAANITPALLTVSSGLAANNKVYDGTTVATISSNTVVLAGVVGADVVSLSTNGYGASFGSAGVSNGIAVGVSGLSLSGVSATNYTLTQPVVLAANITPALLGVTARDTNKVYGATQGFAGTEFSVSGNLYIGNTLTNVNLSSTGAAASATVGSYAIVPSGAQGVGLSNYTIFYTNGTLTVTGAVLTVTANNASRPYGSGNPVFSGTITGIQNGDNITATYATTATASSPVGTYPIVPTLVDPGNKLPNYAVTTNNGILTVTAPPAPTILSIVGSPGNTNVTITWTSISNSVYRVQYKTSLASTSWLNLAPDVTATGTTASFTDQPGTASQRYYRVVLLLTETPLIPLVVVANDASRVYGGINPVFSGTVTGVQSGDNITATYATAATPSSPVGTYPITPSLVDPDGNLDKYLVTMTNGTLTVTGAVLTVTANNASRPYGAGNPVFSGTITGIQNGDNITATYATTATASSPVGTYPIVPTLVDPGNKLPNYAVTTNNGILTVTAPPAPTILSIVGSPGNTNVTITWTSISNSVYRVQYKTSLASTSWLNLAPDVTATGTTASFTDQPGTASQRYYRVVLLLTETPLIPLVVVANDASRAYGGINPVFSGTITGVQSGDNITATYATAATPSSPVGTYPITPSLVDPDGNLDKYLVTMTNGTLTVTGAVLTVTANNASRPYGSGNPVFSGTITGIQNGDNITATYATTATASSPVGTYPIVPTLVDPGNKLPNYAVATNNGILTVTAPPAPTILSIVGSPGNTNVTITWTSISNSVYRVQYKTSLASTSWLNLAPDVTATGTTASFTDQPGTESQRFYRVLIP